MKVYCAPVWLCSECHLVLGRFLQDDDKTLHHCHPYNPDCPHSNLYFAEILVDEVKDGRQIESQKENTES